jgi:hypothetical protein
MTISASRSLSRQCARGAARRALSHSPVRQFRGRPFGRARPCPGGALRRDQHASGRGHGCDLASAAQHRTRPAEVSAGDLERDARARTSGSRAAQLAARRTTGRDPARSRAPGHALRRVAVNAGVSGKRCQRRSASHQALRQHASLRRLQYPENFGQRDPRSPRSRHPGRISLRGQDRPPLPCRPPAARRGST